MRKILLIFLFLATFLEGQDLGTLRLEHYQTFLQTLAKKPKETQLEQINLYFNAIVNEYDTHVWGTEDYWATPDEFIARGSGDCEDFVIAKYKALESLGFDPKKMMIYIVKVENERDYHAVLGVKNDLNQTLILDNLSWKILPVEKRSDLNIVADVKKLSPTNTTNRLLLHVYQHYHALLEKLAK